MLRFIERINDDYDDYDDELIQCVLPYLELCAVLYTQQIREKKETEKKADRETDRESKSTFSNCRPNLNKIRQTHVTHNQQRR